MSDVESLKNENNALKCELSELREETEKRCIQCEQICKENHDLQSKIRFLEGQIEAYQYCLNCRR